MIDLSLLQHLTIGFSAPRGTGKDTVANSLAGKVWFQQKHLCYRDKFAAPLYRCVAALTGWAPEQLMDETTKEVVWEPTTAPTQSLIGWSPRKLMQFIGTEVVREQLGVNHWVELMKARLAQRTHGVTLITDVRFVNEAFLADAVIELRREGVEYADDHVTNQRLPAACITETIWLKPRAEIDWEWMAEHIIVTAQRAREQKS
jgi:hypothetical protein